MNHSACFYPEVASGIRSLEVAHRAFHHLTFQTARGDAYVKVVASTWKVALDKEGATTAANVATAVYNEEPVEFETCHIETAALMIKT